MSQIFSVERLDEGQVLTHGTGFLSREVAESVCDALNTVVPVRRNFSHNSWHVMPIEVDDTETLFIPQIQIQITGSIFATGYAVPSSVPLVKVVEAGTPLPETVRNPPTDEWPYWNCFVYGRTLEEVNQKALTLTVELNELNK